MKTKAQPTAIERAKRHAERVRKADILSLSAVIGEMFRMFTPAEISGMTPQEMFRSIETCMRENP